MKLSKKLLSLLLCAVMVLGTIAIGGDGFAEVMDAFMLKADAYSTGDYIYYGSYPQTDVTDSLGAVLNNQPGTWQSYGYYSGTGSNADGQMKPSNYMRYKDVSYNGNKYRAVTFDSYRPFCTGYTSSASNTCQNDNGYTTGNVYWFKYEPIKWRVLDPSTGLIMCDTAIDSQAYNNYIISSNGEYYGDPDCTYYASNYAKSSIREWLNKDFYNTAFSSSQQSNILYTTLDNSAYSTSYSAYDSESTTDKVFLLSYDDVLNSKYGFSTSTGINDSARQLKGSDYAKSQGLDVYHSSDSSYDGCSFWRLRSPGGFSNFTCFVYFDGYVYGDDSTYYTGHGVVPALKLSNLKSDTAGSAIGSSGSSDSPDGEESKNDLSSNNSDKSDNNDFLYTNLDPANKSDYDPAEIIENQAGLDSGFNNKNSNKSNNETKILLGALIALAVIILAILIIFLIKRNEKQPIVNKDFVAPEYYPVEPPYQLIPGGSYGVCQRCKNETDNIFIFKMKENGVEHSAQVCENCGKALADIVRKRKG